MIALYEAIKTTSLYISYHEQHGTFPAHLHVVSCVSQPVKSQKVQLTFNKLAKRLKLSDETASQPFKQLMKKTVSPQLPICEQRKWANALIHPACDKLENGKNVAKPTPFHNICAQSIGTDMTNCCQFVDSQILVASGMVDSSSILPDDLESQQGPDNDEDSDIESEAKWSKNEKWEFLDGLFTSTGATNLNELNLRMPCHFQK